MSIIAYGSLRGKLVEKGLTYKDMATILHISETSFVNKINGRTEWKLNEIITILDTLGCGFNDLFR